MEKNQESSVVPQPQSTQSIEPQVPQPPLQTPVPSKNSNTIIIIAIAAFVILAMLCVCCAGAVVLASRDGTGNVSLNNDSKKDKDTSSNATTTPKPTIEEDTPLYVNGKEYPPVSSQFSNEITFKKRSLEPSSGYISNINALGNPSYTFSILYNPEWKTNKFTENTYVLKSTDNRVETSVLYFSKDSKQFKSMTCYEIVKDIFAGYDFEGTDLGKVTVNNEKWNRVSYTVNKGKTNEAIGTDQCLDRDDAVILHSIVATKSNWEANKANYAKMLDDVYVSKESLKY